MSGGHWVGLLARVGQACPQPVAPFCSNALVWLDKWGRGETSVSCSAGFLSAGRDHPSQSLRDDTARLQREADSSRFCFIRRPS